MGRTWRGSRTDAEVANAGEPGLWRRKQSPCGAVFFASSGVRGCQSQTGGSSSRSPSKVWLLQGFRRPQETPGTPQVRKTQETGCPSPPPATAAGTRSEVTGAPPSTPPRQQPHLRTVAQCAAAGCGTDQPSVTTPTARRQKPSRLLGRHNPDPATAAPPSWCHMTRAVVPRDPETSASTSEPESCVSRERSGKAGKGGGRAGRPGSCGSRGCATSAGGSG